MHRAERSIFLPGVPTEMGRPAGPFTPDSATW